MTNFKKNYIVGRGSISPQTVKKWLKILPEKFTAKEAKKCFDEKRVLTEINISTIYTRIHRMKNLNAVERTNPDTRPAIYKNLNNL